MKRHVFAFLIALMVWVMGNFVASVLAQEGAIGSRVSLATWSSAPNAKTIAPNAKTIVPNAKTIRTDDARCVQSDYCSAWYLFSCNGHLPNCNGGCWKTGYYPCSACVESPGDTCVQEQVTVNAKLYRSDCTSSSGYYCDACVGNYVVYLQNYWVTTWRCRW